MSHSIAEIEKNIQVLEAWADTCTEGTDLELRSILVQKICTLSNRLTRVRHVIDYCPNCHTSKEASKSFGHECWQCGWEFPMG